MLPCPLFCAGPKVRVVYSYAAAREMGLQLAAADPAEQAVLESEKERQQLCKLAKRADGSDPDELHALLSVQSALLESFRQWCAKKYVLYFQ